MTSPRLLLYSTDHCALCDAALDLLLSMPELGGLPLDVVDISTDPALIATYGERLPVLALATASQPPTQPILAWPFAASDVSRWIAQLK